MTEIQKKIDLTSKSYIDAISKKLGKKDKVVSPKEHEFVHEWLSSGSIMLDYALGGGFPCGRIIEIMGMESSGKTTLTTHAMIEAQKKGWMCGFVDTEHAFDFNYAENLGLDSDIVYAQPDNGEEAFTIIQAMIESGVKLVILDSVAAMVTKAEMEGEFGQANMGGLARLMSQSMRKLTGLVSKTESIVIFINQFREKITMYGDPKVTTGGNALKFYATQRLVTSRKTIKENGGEINSQEFLVDVIKNKVADPFKKAELIIRFGEGIDLVNDKIQAAIALGIIEKQASWFSFNGETVAQGMEKLRRWFNDNPDIEDLIKSKFAELKSKQ